MKRETWSLFLKLPVCNAPCLMQTSMLRGNGTLLSTPEVDIELQFDDLFFGNDMIEEKVVCWWYINQGLMAGHCSW